MRGNQLPVPPCPAAAVPQTVSLKTVSMKIVDDMPHPKDFGHRPGNRVGERVNMARRVNMNGRGHRGAVMPESPWAGCQGRPSIQPSAATAARDSVAQQHDLAGMRALRRHHHVADAGNRRRRGSRVHPPGGRPAPARPDRGRRISGTRQEDARGNRGTCRRPRYRPPRRRGEAMPLGAMEDQTQAGST